MRLYNIKIYVFCFFMCSCTDSCEEDSDVSFAITYNISKRNVCELLINHTLNSKDLIHNLPSKEFVVLYPMPTDYALVSKNIRIENWREVFEYYKIDTLTYIYFDVDTIQKYGWDKVRTDYKILARYDLTMENIIDLGGIVPYPLQDSTVKIYYPEGLNPFED